MRGDKGRWVRDERKHNWRVSDVPFSPRHLRFLIPSLHLSLHQVLQLQPCNTLNLLSTFTSLSFPSVHVTSPYGSLSERNERYRREVNDVKWARRTWKQRLGPLRFSSHLSSWTGPLFPCPHLATSRLASYPHPFSLCSSCRRSFIRPSLTSSSSRHDRREWKEPEASDTSVGRDRERGERREPSDWRRNRTTLRQINSYILTYLILD